MNNKRRKTYAGCCRFIYSLATVLALSAQAADNYLPVFPVAEGFGAFTPGGRGGQVLFVTTLEDYDSANGDQPIPGSFRQAVQTRGPASRAFTGSRQRRCACSRRMLGDSTTGMATPINGARIGMVRIPTIR